jgi:hypothetical protein
MQLFICDNFPFLIAAAWLLGVDGSHANVLSVEFMKFASSHNVVVVMMG